MFEIDLTVAEGVKDPFVLINEQPNAWFDAL